MARKKHLKIEVSGYITRIVCGKIPFESKKAFIDYLLNNRAHAATPTWIKKRNPNYLSSEEINRLWYFDNSTMQRLMRGTGLDWKTHWGVNEFCDIKGFGSGKEGIGLFEIGVSIDNKPVMKFYPFEPVFESNLIIGKMDDIRICWKIPLPEPSAGRGFVAVSAGTWAKGTAFFSAKIQSPFLKENLEMELADLTNTGTGEDCFVTGFRYEGRSLPIEITRETDRQFLPVSWFSNTSRKWLHMSDPG